MSQHYVSLMLAFLILFQSIKSLPVEAKESSCENGECARVLIDNLENLNSAFKFQCLPKGIQENEIKAYFKKNGLNENCWNIITEVSNLEKKLLALENELENKLGCSGENCKTENPESLNSQIVNLSTPKSDLKCSLEQKKKINQTCQSDRECALMSSVLSLNSNLAILMSPKLASENCNVFNDSCFTQIGTSFAKSVFSLFEFGWEILDSAISSSYDKMKNLWNSTFEKEDYSSTSQLALAKASEDPGFFQALIDDFPGTMLKIWNGFLSGIDEWLKSDLFCSNWSGIAHFSECLVPADDLDCLSCKAKINGLCSAAGTIASEIIPSFLTGGLVAAAKYGSKVASSVAKSFKISSKARAALKETHLAKLAVKTSSKMDEVLKLTNKLKGARTLVQSALSAIKYYYLNPVRKIVKFTYLQLTELAKLPGLQVAMNGTSKVLVFAGQTIKYTGKVVLYPVDNPMTAFAFKAGERSFNKIIKLSSVRLVVPSSSLITVFSKHPNLEKILAEIETINLSKAPATKKLLELEEELLKNVTPLRQEIISKNIDLDLTDIIHDFYPELKYGALSDKIGFKMVVEAEKELLALLGPSSKGKMLMDYIIIANSKLTPADRLKKAMLQINKTATPKLALALQNAHQFGEGSVFGYSWSSLRGKYRILTEGGFSPSDANDLIRRGFVGNPPASSIILRPNESNQEIAHNAITHDLYNGEVTSIRRFSENDNRNEIFLVTIKGNPDREAIFKPRFFGDIDGWGRTPMEYVSYYLNRKLGMDYVPPIAYRQGMNLKFGDQTFTEGAFSFKAPEYKAMSKLENETFPIASEEILSDHRVLSVLLLNPDGHYKNLGLGRHWVDGVERPVFLDWNACLRNGSDVSMTNYTATGNTLPVTKIRQETYDHLKILNQDDFEPLVNAQFVTNEEIKQILSRRDEILKYFENLEKNAKSRKEVFID